MFFPVTENIFFYGKLEPTKPSKTRCFCTSGPPCGLPGASLGPPWGLPGRLGLPWSSWELLGNPEALPGASLRLPWDLLRRRPRSLQDAAACLKTHAPTRPHARLPARPPARTHERTHACTQVRIHIRRHARACVTHLCINTEGWQISIRAWRAPTPASVRSRTGAPWVSPLQEFPDPDPLPPSSAGRAQWISTSSP